MTASFLSVNGAYVKSYKCGTILLLFVFAVLMPLAAVGAESFQKSDFRADFGVLIHDYKWAEYADDGPKLLEETGNLYGFGYDIESLKSRIGWRTGGHFFLGEVDYSGQTWTDIPVTTDVWYAGGEIYADVVPGYRFDSGLWLKSFAGVGTRFWLRDLQDTRTGEGDPVSGAREWWGYLYGRAGLGAEFPVTKDIMVFGEFGLKLPIYARNEAEFFLSGSPSVGLEPEAKVSGFGAAGCRWKQWGAKITYDALRFDRSDAVSSGMYSLYQPRSEADVYSVEVFWSKGF